MDLETSYAIAQGMISIFALVIILMLPIYIIVKMIFD